MTENIVCGICIGSGLLIGGIVIPIVINYLCDKWGWFR